jgi:prepilin-type N-terminal cleavage/methylation domain-containing protein
MPVVSRLQHNAGFTLIELLVAMAVFSFMMLIIATGFINIVRLHNQAVVSNLTQDSANSAIQTLVQAVRDSHGVSSVSPNPVNAGYGDLLCLKGASGADEAYYIDATNVLMKATTCATLANKLPLTGDTVVKATYFKANQVTSGPAITNGTVQLSVTMASAVGVTSYVGPNVQCADSNGDRAFCSVMTLTSGAVPR